MKANNNLKQYLNFSLVAFVPVNFYLTLIYIAFRVRKRRMTEIKKKSRMQCPKCERSFQKYENFEAHMRNHFGKKVII